jgi:succinate dehydrogenase/fumarate reductase flavoprotein subunit
MTQDDESGVASGSRLSRRAFLRAAGIGTGAAALGEVWPTRIASGAEGTPYDLEVDVAVVGSSGAGFAAACLARQAGAEKVAIFEKGAFVGGTTLKSGGVYWVPNNPLMQAAGFADPREDALRYMARLSYPELYSPARPRFGLHPGARALHETFYDRGAEILERLRKGGVLEYEFWPGADGRPFPDYHAELPENRSPRGRSIVTRNPDGYPGTGNALIGAFEKAAERLGIDIHLRSAATRLVVNDADEVVGLELATREGSRRVRARRGVVFASGGFPHNKVLVDGFLRGPAYGACEVATNEGDFIAIAQSVGARLNNMKSAAWKQVVLDQVLAFGSIPNGVAAIPGDSSLMVNRYGKRVGNEKLNYNQRAQVHFDWDARENQYGNQLLFMIYDARTAELFAGVEPIPLAGAEHPEVLTAPSLAALGRAIDARLESFDEVVLRFRLDSGFAESLAATVERFNGFARSGKDLDFARGETEHEAAFHGPRREGNALPNALLHPLSETGPYHALILAAGTFGTRGGPEIDPRSRVLHAEGHAIAGLYGAGNCIASPAAGGYWGGGAQIGPGIVFGGIAGLEAAAEPVRPWV